MQIESYYYCCSRQFIDSISSSLQDELIGVVSNLPKRNTQSEVNQDIFWLLTSHGWSYDSVPANLDLPQDLPIDAPNLDQIKKSNSRDLCLTTTTLDAGWRADFAKAFKGLVQIEAQFGKVEAMFKDFCGFKIARYERRLSLGIEIVMSRPNSYFSHRKQSTSGMAHFDIAKMTLPETRNRHRSAPGLDAQQKVRMWCDDNCPF